MIFIVFKIFDNIKSLTYTFEDQYYRVTAMTTYNDEILVFKNDIVIKNSVDKWMNKVIEQMHKSNRFMIKKAILELGNISCPNTRCDWISNFPESICLTADNVWWAVEVENVFNEINLVSEIQY